MTLQVMQRLMQHLKMDVPLYVRVDRLVVAHTLKQSRQTFSLSSVFHGSFVDV